MAVDIKTKTEGAEAPRIDPAHPPRVVTKYTAGGLRGHCFESGYELRRGLAILKKERKLQGIRDVGVPPDATKVVGTAEEIRLATSVTTKWTPPDYHRLFCAHDRARWAVCPAATCRRTASEARGFWKLLAVGKV
jgi:hypothetical protein